MRSWRLCTSIWWWQSSSSTRPSLYLSSAAGSGRALFFGNIIRGCSRFYAVHGFQKSKRLTLCRGEFPLSRIDLVHLRLEIIISFGNLEKTRSQWIIVQKLTLCMRLCVLSSPSSILSTFSLAVTSDSWMRLFCKPTFQEVEQFSSLRPKFFLYFFSTNFPERAKSLIST